MMNSARSTLRTTGIPDRSKEQLVDNNLTLLKTASVMSKVESTKEKKMNKLGIKAAIVGISENVRKNWLNLIISA